MAMLRIIDSIQSPTLTKSRISGRESNGFAREKKLKAQFPNTSENMNVLQFLGFQSDEIKSFSSMVLTYTSEGIFTQYGLCKGCQKMFGALCLWAGQKVSYRRWLGKH
ncbi:ADI_G0039840.mRNA.1.CDS.1 [Saccharomyces cerevisiae]|nr:ADI_G0039840.mRNA.1.CDS.1 [Saccharomyces cerevisiae]CAI6829679.1 ADI_G0039840.mRNA.1.CDS.1 [Saccharomyces cerevisiae]